MASDLPLRDAPEGVLLHVRLTPKAAKDALGAIEADADGKLWLKAAVTAVPEKGKANIALIKLIAKKLRLPKSGIRLIAGGQSRQKTLLIEGDSATLMPDLIAAFAELGV